MYAEEKKISEYFSTIASKVVSHALKIRNAENNGLDNDCVDAKPMILIDKLLDLEEKGLMDRQRVIDQINTFIGGVSDETRRFYCKLWMQNLLPGYRQQFNHRFKYAVAVGDESICARSCLWWAANKCRECRLHWFRYIDKIGISRSRAKGINAIASNHLYYCTWNRCRYKASRMYGTQGNDVSSELMENASKWKDLGTHCPDVRPRSFPTWRSGSAASILLHTIQRWPSQLHWAQVCKALYQTDVVSSITQI